jgi:hypothetical protein
MSPSPSSASKIDLFFSFFFRLTNRTLDAKKEGFSVEQICKAERGREFLDAHEEEEEEDGIHGRRPGGEHRDVED